MPWTEDKKRKLTKLVFLLIAAYLAFQIVWWIIHLLDLHLQVYELQVLNNGDLPHLEKWYQKKIWMVLGEGFVFIGLLAISLRTLNKHQKRESEITRQEKNFVLAITHELKTPVATIRLFIDTILKRDLTKEKQIELLTDAKKETVRLDQLVENMLLSARLEQGKSGGFDEHVNLSELVKDSCYRLHKYLGVEHSLNLKIDPDVQVVGEYMSLESMVSNLYENAVKYGGKGVQIDVRLMKKEAHCLLEIQDNGPGIEEIELTKVFQKFYRVGNEETRSAKGTGIGLYMVKQIVEAHRGEVTVSQVSPQGVKFQVKLPYEK